MSSIDKRIVQMQFDNQNFESGVKTTMSTLQRLNEKLKMKSSTGGLDDVTKSVSKLSSGLPGLSALSSGVDTVSSKFSALGVIAVTALANITNSAVNAGKNLVKSFAIDPILDGFNEYELKMNSIQTILTNTAKHGTTLEDVNSALSELNEYSDQTIYNFAQMTDNIGKATAAGLTLDQAVTFVKGMSNAAAGFGVDATKMAGATYQMTQALSAGVIRLQDWNSLQQAGMGGEMIQEEMYKAAESLGVFVDKTVPFRDSLQSGWLTAEVFMLAMQNMANDPSLTKAASEVTSFTKLLGTLKEQIGSGWAESFEHIFGNKDESTALWTGISEAIGNVINKSAEARNKMLKDWSDLGGRNAMIRGFTNIFESLGKGFKAIGSAWKEVFPSWTGAKLTELSTKFRDFTYKIKMSDETAQKIKDTFKGVFNVFKTVGSAIAGVIKAFTPLLGIFKPIGSGLLDMSSSIGKFVTKISDAVSKSKAFSKIGEGVGKVFTSIGEHISGAYDKITGFFSGLDFSNVTSAFSKVASTIGQFMSSIGTGLGKALGSINFDTLINMGKGLAGLGIFKVVKNIFDEFKGVGDGLTSVFDSFKGIGEGITDVLDGVKESLSAWQNSLNATSLLKLAGAIGILAASLLVLATIEPGRLASALAGIAGLFTELSLAMVAIDKIGSVKGLMKMGTGMILISTAVLILSGAMKKLSGLNVGEVITGLVSVAGLLATLVVATKAFGKSSKGLISTSTGLIIFGAAMHVMAGALKKLGEIDAKTIGTGLIALAGILTELALFLAAAKFGDLGITDSVGILVLAASLLVLEQAVSKFGSLNTDEIIRGLAGIAGILAEIAVFSHLTGGFDLIGTGAGLAAVSAGMLIMSSAMKSLAEIQWEEMARGLVAMAGGLAVMGVASALISGGQLILLGIGVAAMGAALLVLSAALKSMGNMSWEQIGKSMVVLAGSLVILAVAMYAMTGAVVGALALIVLAGALALMVPPLVALGNMSMAEIGKSLLMLASSLIVLGLAGAAIGVVAPLIALAGAAIILLGVGCLAAGAGITMVATGMAALASTFASSGTTIINFIDQLIAKLPEIGTKAVEGFANFMGALGSALPQITAGFTAIITALLTAIGTMVPQFVQTGLDIAVKFAQGLAQAVPQLVTAGMELVLGVLEGIAANIGQIVEAGADIIVNFLDGVANALPRVIQSGINLALSFIEGVADGISSNTGRLESAIRSVMDAMIQAGLAVIRGAISPFTSGGTSMIQGLISGISSMAGSAGSAVTGVINTAKQAASGLGSALVGAGKSLIEGLVSGITSMASSVASAAKSVVEGAITAAKSALKINSPSKVFIEIGKFTSEGFAVGLDKYAGRASDSATDLANGVVNNVEKPLSNIAKIIDSGLEEINAVPTITPVMDLSNIQAGTKRLGGMLQDGTMQINAKTGVLAGSIGTVQNGTGNADVVAALKDLKDNLNNSGPSYNINGITYDDGSNVVNAVETLVRAARIERRI